MTYQELIENAKARMNGKCLHCAVCDGVACKGVNPGPGAKGTGDSFTRNYRKLQEIKIQIDTIYKSCPVTTSAEFFGHPLKYPFLVAPIGSVDTYYGEYYDDQHYTMDLLLGAREAGIAVFTGDGPNPNTFYAPMAAIQASGVGIPTFKPRDLEDAKKRIQTAEENGALAIAVDIDALGIPALRNLTPPVQAKTVEELAEIRALTKLPFIIKGVMNVKMAKKAVEAGACAIVVSTHGGRVQDQLPAAAEMLPAIADAVGNQVLVMADGGVRSGNDVFKLLALGADLVLIGRPYVTAVYGGAQEGVVLYTEKIGQELLDTMYMTGAATVKAINRNMIYWPEGGYSDSL